MKRRTFITLLGGAAAAWPLAARAQQPGRMRLVCILQGVSADTPGQKARDAAFLEGLQHLGWTPRPCGVWLRRELVPAGLQRNRLYDV
jgi:putative ABC transport system substrate-binding protein